VLNRYRSTYGFSAEVGAGAVEALIEQAEVVYMEQMKTHQKMDPQSFPLTSTDLAHAAGFTGRGVTIAIIDDGIEHDHPAFGGDPSFPNAKIIGGRDFETFWDYVCRHQVLPLSQRPRAPGPSWLNQPTRRPAATARS